MKLTKWKLEDTIKTECDLMDYMHAALDEDNVDFFFIACRDVVRIAKKRGWLKRRRLSWLKNKD